MKRTSLWLGCLFLIVVILPRAAAQDEKKVILKVDGKIANTDPKDKVRQDCYHKSHIVKLEAGATYQIDMIGVGGFDTFLRLEDADGKQLAEDDDGGEDLDARIIFQAPKAGTYRIICTTYEDNDTGAYTLIVTRTAGGKKEEKKKKQ
jgi:hypothetical protein